MVFGRLGLVFVVSFCVAASDSKKAFPGAVFNARAAGHLPGMILRVLKEGVVSGVLSSGAGKTARKLRLVLG